MQTALHFQLMPVIQLAHTESSILKLCSVFYDHSVWLVTLQSLI